MFKKKMLALTPFLALPMIVVSCGKTVDSPEKVAQDPILKKEAKTMKEQLNVRLILQDLYKVGNLQSELEKKDSEYYKDAYSAFNVYSKTQIAKDPLYFYTKEQEWKNKFKYNAYGTADLTFNQTPDENKFVAYIKNIHTGIEFEINKMLLVKKYFLTDKKGSLTKGNGVVKLDIKYDQNQYNLIDYVLKNKPSQQWQIVSKNASDIFTGTTETISNWKQFNEIATDQKYYSQKVSQDLSLGIVNGTQDFGDYKLYGYVGLVKNGLSSFGDLNKLYDRNNFKVDRVVVKHGFYDTQNKVLRGYNELDKHPIAPWLEASKELKATYMNLIIPDYVKAKITDSDYEEKRKEDKKYDGYISFSSKSYSPEKLNVLIYLLSVMDPKIYTDLAIKFYEKLGYKIESDVQAIKDGISAK